MVLLPTIPPEFAGIATSLQEGLSRVLSEQLVGLYLYGSILDASFVPGRSDMDAIVVTQTSLDDQTFSELGSWLGGPVAQDPAAERVQLSFLVRDRVLEDDPSACLYQFGVLRHSGSDGNPIIWFDFLQRGHTLLGADPQTFLPKITPALLHEALVREVDYLREGLGPDSEWRDRESYRTYAVLTLCRILYTNATSQLASKRAAAEWAQGHVPEEWHQLIHVAAGVSDQAWVARTTLDPILHFIDFVAERIAEK